MIDKTLVPRPSLMAILRSDFIHQKAGTWYEKEIPSPGVLGLLLLFFTCREFKVAARFRIAHWCYHRNLKVLAKWTYLRTKIGLGVDIHPAATIGSGLMIQHGTDMVIGREVRIGGDAVIMNGVTLGGRMQGADQFAQPRIGDGAVIGTGAKVLGGLHLGDGVRIGANAVVLAASGLNDKVYVGVPAREIDAR